MDNKPIGMVGDLSDWIELSDALRHFCKPDPENAEAGAARLEWLAQELAGIAVRVLVLSYEDAQAIDAGYRWAANLGRDAQKAETLDQVERAARAKAQAVTRAVCTGLAEVRGLELGELSESVKRSIAASGYGWLVGEIVVSYQGIDQEHRAGFFTQALEPQCSTAPDAPTTKSAADSSDA